MLIGSDPSRHYSLIFNMAQMQAINASNATLASDYALGASIDASSTQGWTPIGVNSDGTPWAASNTASAASSTGWAMPSPI